MPNAANVNIKFINEQVSQSTPLSGISFVYGVTEKGYYANPKDIITNWTQYQRIYGGLMANNEFPLQCKLMLDNGTKLRISRVGHYTDITDATTLTAEKATLLPIANFNIATAMIAGQKLRATLGAVVIDQLFTVDTNQTIQLFIDQLAELTGTVLSVSKSSHTLTSNFKFQTLISEASTIEVTIVPVGLEVVPVVTKTIVTGITNEEGVVLFTLTPKYEGATYNELTITKIPSTNGSNKYFGLEITIGDTTETYNNIQIKNPSTQKNVGPTIEESNYLIDIINQSQLVDVEYKDLSTTPLYNGYGGQLWPGDIVNQMFGGSDSDPSTIVDSDYIGDSGSKTGMFAFNPYYDGYVISDVILESEVVAVAGEAYCRNRKDLRYWAHLPNSKTTTDQLITYRDLIGSSSKYISFFGGGVKLYDTLTNQMKEVSEIGTVINLLNYTHNYFGQWYSFAGPNRGVLSGVNGIVNNFGSPADYESLNLLAQHQINMVINRDGKNMLWGNFTSQVDINTDSFNANQMLEIYMAKNLRPTLEYFIEEPLDFPLFKQIYEAVKPFLDSLVRGRAIFSYEWLGDQGAASFADLQINVPGDIQTGKYKVKCKIVEIVSLQEIELTIIKTSAGITIE